MMNRVFLPLVMLLSLAATLVGAGDSTLPPTSVAGPWVRGDFGTLSVAADGSSYTFSYGTTTFKSLPINGTTGAAPTSSSGRHPVLGGYDELSVPARGGSLAVRYFTSVDAFVFERRPATGAAETLAAKWPSFSIADQPANRTRCLGWSEHYFYPGGIETELSGCSSGGPLFLFDAPPPPPSPAAPAPAPTMLLSPLSDFTCNSVANCPPHKKGTPVDPQLCALSVDASGKSGHCLGWHTSAVLLARPGLTRATRAFGALVRRVHNTTRSRGPGVNQLSYWNDNQAGYSWWTAGPDQAIWGTPEDIYVKLKEGYDKAGIPIMGWEPDNNFVVDYRAIKNWIGVDWNLFDKTYYPSGGEAWVAKMGNISMTYYTNGFDENCTHQRSHPMVKGGGGLEPHPNTSYQFYTDLFRYNQQHFNMEMLFTDFLCYRGPSMGSYQDVPVGEEGSHMWLAGQTRAAQDLGVEVQWCMALAHQILESVEFPAVTNARANGDGGLAVESLPLTGLLASMVGLGWSKDNLRTADRCYVNGTYPNGTLMWPCGSINHGEGTSGKFIMQEQQTMLATLSLGPVGISDQLSARPEDPDATITSNKTLVMATCSTDGTLLQPSYPLTPIERMVTGAGEFGDCFGATHRAYTYGCGGHAWATYTAVPISSSEKTAGGDYAARDRGASTGIWWTALGFYSGRGGWPGSTNYVTLHESDLAPMVDASALPSPDFGSVPAGAFRGAGVQLPNASSSSGHVVWAHHFVGQAGCAGVLPEAWNGSAHLVVQPPPHKGGSHTAAVDHTSQLNIAPLIGGVALLGEAGKVTSVSSYRFSAVVIGAGGKGVQVKLRGKPGEQVTLLFATGDSSAGYKCNAVHSTIDADGSGSVAFGA